MTLVACQLLWACQQEVLPGLQGQEGEAKTVQLGFALSTAQTGTRMSANDMGIDLPDNEKGKLRSVTLIPHAVSGAIGGDTDPIGDNITLGENAGEITLYENVQIPIGTRSFLVYGLHAKANEGKLAATFDKPAKNIMFSPVSFMENGTDEYNTFKGEGQKLLDYITKIANTQYSDNGTTKSWSKTDNGEMLSLYKEFISLKPGGDLADKQAPMLAVASSSVNVMAMVQDFYDRLKGKTDALSKKLVHNMVNHEGINLLKDGQISFDVENSRLPNDFPTSVGLPAGSAACKWDNAAEKFIDQAVTVSTLQIAPTECYTYPVALWYRANSPILTSENSEQELYGSSAVWNDVTTAYDNSQGVVTTKTQSVAIKEELQYAVAQFAVTVNAVGNTLIDNSGSEVHIMGAETFPLTGILVGGQRAVNFEFHQIDNASPSFTAYDQNVSGWSLMHYTTLPSTPIRTLVLESHPTYKVDGHFVPITFALEFRNDSGADFIGVDKKIIAPGCKFYLIGDILPQEKGDGTPTFKEGDLVFKQDCVTKVDVTVKSLKNAYYIIPDLRDPQLKVGLTVSDWIMSTPSGTKDSPIVM